MIHTKRKGDTIEAMKQRTLVVLLSVITLLGIVLRLPDFSLRSIWFDEAFTWRLILFPFSEMLIRAAADVHPPFYYILVDLWGMLFGTTIVSLRAFSLFWAALTPFIMYRFQLYAFRSRAVALISALFFALSGWQIAFAHEARMYALGIFFSIVATYVLLVAVRRKDQWLWWALYGLIAALFAYIHYFAFFTLFAHVSWLFLRFILETPRSFRAFVTSPIAKGALLAGMSGLLLYSPWIPVFLQQNQQVQAAFWVPPVTRWSIPDTVYRMYIPLIDAPSHEGMGRVVTLIPLVGTIVLWLILLLQRKQPYSDAKQLIVLAAAIPFLLSMLISFLGQSIYQDRFLAFAQPFVLLSLAVILGSISYRTIRYIAMGAAGCLLLWSGLTYRQALNIPNKGGVRQAMAVMMQSYTPSEPIIVNSSFIFFNVDHYISEYYGHPVSPLLYTDSPEVIHFAGGPILQTQDTITSNALMTLNPKSLWVVNTNGFGSTVLTLPAPWKKTQEETFPEVFGYQGEIIVTQYQR